MAITAVSSLGSLSAYGSAPNGVSLGAPVVNGSGCPIGTTAAALAPDGSALSILFNSYQVEAGGNTGKRVERKNCNIAIPIQIPQGYSVSVYNIDYRGFNGLDRGATSRFSVDYFFAGNHGPGFTKTFYGPLNQDFLLSNRLTAEATVWSACGASVDLRISTSMMLQADGRAAQSMASVDSADINSALVYSLQWKRCDGGMPGNGGGGNGGGGNGGWDPGHPGNPNGGYTGNCTIDRDPRNPSRFLVRDVYQGLIGIVWSEREALDLARRSDANGRCLGSSNGGGYGGGNGGGYGGGSRQTVCSINVNGRIFDGFGYDQTSATQDARNSCARSTYSTWACRDAGAVCRLQ